MYDDIAYSKDDFNETSYRRMGIRSMYDDIEYSKDDFDIRSIHGREYAVCMTTLRIVKIVKTIFVHVAFINKNERQMC